MPLLGISLLSGCEEYIALADHADHACMSTGAGFVNLENMSFQACRFHHVEQDPESQRCVPGFRTPNSLITDRRPHQWPNTASLGHDNNVLADARSYIHTNFGFYQIPRKPWIFSG